MSPRLARHLRDAVPVIVFFVIVAFTWDNVRWYLAPEAGPRDSEKLNQIVDFDRLGQACKEMARNPFDQNRMLLDERIRRHAGNAFVC